jgi:hypothetical protein
MVNATGAFGESLGEHPAADFDLYRLNADWLRETVLALLKPVLTTRSINVIDEDLADSSGRRNTLDEGGCDGESKATFESCWAGALTVTWSATGGRTQ